jgi:tRNA (guanine-N7-)-methyltransferase
MSKQVNQRTFKAPNPVIPIAAQAWRAQIKNRPLCIEIGPGVGLHPIQYAKQHPDKFIVGIERTTEKFNKFASRVQHHPALDNILAIHADAVEWIAANIQPEEVDEYFLLYPNPYPKASQKNKRLMHMPFMQYLIATMKVGASITMATNMEFFYTEAKASWQAIESFSLQTDRIINAGIQKPRTHFERKYLADQQNCYELVFVKTS